MNRLLPIVLALIAFIASADTVVTPGQFSKQFCGSAANDNEPVIETDNVTQYGTFLLLSSTGAVDVFVALDGDNPSVANFSSEPLSLSDLGAETLDPVLVTTAGRVYGFRGVYKFIRVLQNESTAATACLLAGNI